MKFISIDSSLRNTGIAVGSYNEGKISVEHIFLNKTEKSKEKTVRASSDTVSRCRETYNFVQGLIKEHNPQVVFVETPSGSQNSSAMKSYGTTCMLIASINPPPIEVTPIEVKLATVGKKTASKQDMIDWAYNLHSNIEWLFKTQKGKKSLVADNEHLADAIAIAYSGIETNEFKRLINLVK